jgi:hypothetical protein
MRSFVAAATVMISINFVAEKALAWEYLPDETNKCLQESKRHKTEELNRVYERAFDYYVEICAASTWQKRGASDGGNYGHAFGGIKGACIVKDSNGKPVFPPKIEFCKKGYVGISSDYIFGNVQWIPTEGRSFFLYADHPPGVILDQAAADRIIVEANLRGIFTGVRYSPGYESEITRDGAKKGLTSDEFRPYWQGNASLGTDFGLAAARGGVDCTRIPMRGYKSGKESQPLKDLIKHLNDKNIEAASKGFDYDGAVNNCTSNFSNALASVGFWPMRDTSGHPNLALNSLASLQDFLKRKKDVSVPYNDLFDAFRIGSELDLESTIREFRQNQAAFEYFQSTGWLKAQAGVMIESIPPLAYMNSVYNPANNTNFASVLTEAQKQFLPYINEFHKKLTGNIVTSWAANMLAGVTRDLFGVQLGELKAIPPRDKSKFDLIRADDTNRATNLLVNLKWWSDLYARYLTDLSSGKFGNDEVVTELIGYFRAQSNEIGRQMLRQAELTPAPVSPCQN